jgi:hypothetical protein
MERKKMEREQNGYFHNVDNVTNKKEVTDATFPLVPRNSGWMDGSSTRDLKRVLSES